jgi:excisionase family DNA binding protein
MAPVPASGKSLALYLHCHPNTVYRLLKERKIPAFRVGSDWRFRRSDIDEWIARQYDTNPPVTKGRKRKSVNSQGQAMKPRHAAALAKLRNRVQKIRQSTNEVCARVRQNAEDALRVIEQMGRPNPPLIGPTVVPLLNGKDL